MLWVRTFDDPKPMLGTVAAQADFLAVPDVGTGNAPFKIIVNFEGTFAAVLAL